MFRKGDNRLFRAMYPFMSKAPNMSIPVRRESEITLRVKFLVTIVCHREDKTMLTIGISLWA